MLQKNASTRLFFASSITFKNQPTAMDFERRVLQTITCNALPSSDTPALVALSGGADSVALLRVLLSLGYTCEAAHCNFRLRGDESERDEKFVRTLCNELEVPLHVAHFDTRKFAGQHKISIEMAARRLRYDFFSQLLASTPAQFVAVAHHSDDNAETLLLNLVRGTGLRGLCGMQYRNGNIVRPLLNVSRKDITDYLASLKQDYVTDSTNLENDVMRNKIRLDVLPLLRKLNPSINDTLHREAQKLREAETMYRWAVGCMLDKIARHGNGDEELATYDIPDGISVEAVLHEWLFPKGFNETQVFEALEAAKQGKKVRFETAESILFFEQDTFFLARKDSFPDSEPIRLPDEGIITLSPTVSLAVEPYGKPVPRHELTCPEYAFADTAKIKGALRLRPLCRGDRFIPFGMRGSKLVSDYMADRKIHEWERMRQFVVVDDEKIIWLVGQRTDDRVKITSATESIICLHLLRH